MITLDKVKGLILTDQQQAQFPNEILRLHQLAAGLAFLHEAVRSFESAYQGQDRASFALGYDPSRPGVPRELVLCMFHWYATSVCNLTRLIGLIAYEAGLAGFKDRVSIRHYCEEVCGPVKLYRDKVGAHFARTSPRAEDNVADTIRSIIDDLTWISGRLWVGALKLHVGPTAPSHEYAWSLTEFHERQAPRYSPRGARA
jgi:hypothetical protein